MMIRKLIRMLLHKILPAIAVFSVLLILSAPAQEIEQEDVKVSALSFSEELTADDETDAEFGRFDAFEVYFSKGDRVLVQVTAEGFSPAIVLIAPDDTTYLAQFPDAGNPASVTYATEIPTAGEWLLVVRADTNATGTYNLQPWWADVASLSLPEGADLCDAVNFIIAHANADFFFIRQAGNNGDIPSVTLPGAISARLVEGEGYVARFYQGNSLTQARDEYGNLVGRLKFCNGGTWEESFQDWRTVDVLNGIKEMQFELREKEREDYRSIVVVIVDESQNALVRNKYSVLVKIRRHAP